jgi:hypothetical protein
MALSVEGSNSSATAVARLEQQSRQQDEVQRASRDRTAEEARVREAQQQAKEAEKPPAPVTNDKGQTTGGNVNTTA